MEKHNNYNKTKSGNGGLNRDTSNTANIIEVNETPDLKDIASFDDMGLKDDILMGICSYGYDKPSPIQRKGIPVMLEKRDVIAQAQSGTGKTATFSISLLNIIDNENTLQGLILAPTRELAEQIHSVITSIASQTKISVCLCIGGDSVKQNIEVIKKTHPQVIVCTPGRINDLIKNQGLSLKHLKYVVIDEADEMLSRGFVDQIKNIITIIPPAAHIALFSATMTREAFSLSDEFMNDPVYIIIQQEQLTLEGIKQYYFGIDDENYKFETLLDLYNHTQVGQAIIYCNEKRRVEFLVHRFTEQGHVVGNIHGNLQSKERREIMDAFRSGNTRILISTDLLARGIDVQQVSLVINYDIPVNKENYIHRIGRSGRFGRKGTAINLVCERDMEMFKEIERFYQTQMIELTSDLNSICNQLN
jgi:translation initiation factor 4A